MGTRPSVLLGIRCEVTAFYWDRTVYRFGTALEAALDKATEGKDSQMKIEQARSKVFREWIGDGAVGPKQFRDPARRG